MTTDKARAKNFDRLYTMAREAAVDAAGGKRAFAIVGSTIRTAFVAQEILMLVNTQDEAISAETVRQIAYELQTRMREDASLWEA